MRALAFAVLTGAGLVLASNAAPTRASGDINWDRIDLPAERANIEQFQLFDQRLQNIGWKLVRGNEPFCERLTPSIGLQLQDIASYGGPDVARRALGLNGDFAVQTAASGSPADASGEFAANREVVRLGALNPNTLEAEERLDWRRLKRVHDHIEKVLNANGALDVGFADGGAVEVSSVPVCATRFELIGEGDKALANGERVMIGVEFPGFAYDEAVFAGGVAHELAHNLLGHTAWLDRNGRGRSHVRQTEKEADRLMPWLLANAGYDPAAAQTFMEQWGPRHGGGLLRKRSHDGWDERVEFIAAEMPKIRELLAETGKADWRTHFQREIDPQRGL